jgi:hypothetical protein
MKMEVIQVNSLFNKNVFIIFLLNNELTCITSIFINSKINKLMYCITT